MWWMMAAKAGKDKTGKMSKYFTAKNDYSYAPEADSYAAEPDQNLALSMKDEDEEERKKKSLKSSY